MSTQKEQTRRRLLDAARHLLLKRGFHNVGLDDIAEAAGVSRQAVYKSHFASKGELLLELVRYIDETEKIAELAAPARTARTALGMFEAVIVAAVKIQARLHDVSRVLSAAALTDADAAAAFRDRMDVKRGALRAAVGRAKAEGLLATNWKPEEAVDLLFVLTSVDTYQHLVVENGWKPEAMIQKIWELCQATFLKGGEASAAPGARRRRH